MFKRRRKEVPALNTTSTADISFMLLIFFLVTSSMDTDKGLPRQLPPPDDSTEQQEVEVKKRNVLELRLDKEDRLTCNGEPINTTELTARVAEFVMNKSDDAQLPEKSEREVHLLGRCRVSDRHLITVEADRLTTYNAYFEMQNAVVRGYAKARNELALQHFGHSLAQCSQEERDALAMVYPQRISETMPVADGPENNDE
jgi:biopolymer transport protein ExbD